MAVTAHSAMLAVVAMVMALMLVALVAAATGVATRHGQRDIGEVEG